MALPHFCGKSCPQPCPQKEASKGKHEAPSKGKHEKGSAGKDTTSWRDNPMFNKEAKNRPDSGKQDSPRGKRESKEVADMIETALRNGVPRKQVEGIINNSFRSRQQQMEDLAFLMKQHGRAPMADDMADKEERRKKRMENAQKLQAERKQRWWGRWTGKFSEHNLGHNTKDTEARLKRELDDVELPKRAPKYRDGKTMRTRDGRQARITNYLGTGLYQVEYLDVWGNKVVERGLESERNLEE